MKILKRNFVPLINLSNYKLLFFTMLKNLFGFGYENYDFIGFWSKRITQLIGLLIKEKGRAFATHHDRALECLNEILFNNLGIFNKEYRVRGQKYPDLKLEINSLTKSRVSVEYTLHSSGIKFLKQELKRRIGLFLLNDWFYFSFFLQREPKDKSKSLKVDSCIYYLVVICFSRKKVQEKDLNDLVSRLRMEHDDFVEKLAQESGVDLDEDDLIPVENIITVVELKRQIEVKNKALEEKDKALEEKDKIIKEQEKEIKRLKQS